MQRTTRFVVLVPHRDALASLEAWRGKLFAAGMAGAHSLPAAAPLAVVPRPLDRDVLRAAARALREATLSRGGWIRSAGTAVGTAAGITVYGLRLDLPVDAAWSAVTPADHAPAAVLSPVVLAGAVVTGRDAVGAAPPPPGLAFRAAMLANLSARPLRAGAAGYSFRWVFGEFCWLPAFR